MAIPFQSGSSYRSLYPDFLVVRKEGGRLVVDILDPHNPSLADAVDKAKGLAVYAERHGDRYGRIELVSVQGDDVSRLDLQDPGVRARVGLITTEAQLKALFDEVGRRA
ncbi:hypothetical protein FJY70_04515 [candidate division WOR-3 bacterium]|nr:hypothetical protein [candidate division WOR-3 bacterium]